VVCPGLLPRAAQNWGYQGSKGSTAQGKKRAETTTLSPTEVPMARAASKIAGDQAQRPRNIREHTGV
jgi:hypothetical protein